MSYILIKCSVTKQLKFQLNKIGKIMSQSFIFRGNNYSELFKDFGCYKSY